MNPEDYPWAEELQAEPRRNWPFTLTWLVAIPLMIAAEVAFVWWLIGGF